MSLDEITKAAVKSLMSGEPMQDRKRIEESVEVSFIGPLRVIISEELEPVLLHLKGELREEVKKEIIENIVNRFLKEIGPN
jgi:hypothetical protein